MSNTQHFIEEPSRSTPVKAETEVLVIGGGSAGVPAAVAAVRTGADVILVERLGYLGGLATGGLIIVWPLARPLVRLPPWRCAEGPGRNR
jgi:heterodisulfide reductase subunit A-like polyferredoxin